MSFYNFEIGYYLSANESLDKDSELDDYIKKYTGLLWIASDFSPRSGKRCNCYRVPKDIALEFQKDLPNKFFIDEVGIIEDDNYIVIYPYPRKNMSGDVVYDILNKSRPLQQFCGICLGLLGI